MKKFYLSQFTDPYINLALENFLLEEHIPDNEILLIYLNSPSIIIGRNQNPFAECHIQTAINQNINLVRRTSGGGAVFHDLGNLNFCFINNKNKFSKDKNHQVIKDSLFHFGITVTANERGDLTYCNKKVSGNAYRHKKESSLHHGTLLVNTDLEKLHGLLRDKAPDSFRYKGIPSVKSEVINLSVNSPALSIELLILELERQFAGDEKMVFSNKSENYFKIIEKSDFYRSQDWIWKSTPDFSVVDKNNLDLFTINKGLVYCSAKELNSFFPCSFDSSFPYILTKIINNKKVNENIIKKDYIIVIEELLNTIA